MQAGTVINRSGPACTCTLGIGTHFGLRVPPKGAGAAGRRTPPAARLTVRWAVDMTAAGICNPLPSRPYTPFGGGYNAFFLCYSLCAMREAHTCVA